MNLKQLLNSNFPEFNFEFDYPLGQKSYFKLGGNAESYLEVEKLEDLQKIIKFANQNKIKFTIIGGLSNVIVDDAGVSGLVLKIKNGKWQMVNGKLVVGAGLSMQRLVMKSMQEELSGLENFYGVPGSLGGAIYNNAHYLEDLIADYVTRVQIVAESGVAKWLDQKDCEFAYDHSRFQTSNEIIWAVEFALEKLDSDKEKQASKDKLKKAQDKRAATQPLSLPSSGCVFQNTPNNDHLRELFPEFAERDFVPTGFLIDRAGLKNTSIGDLEVSDKHAAFIINRGHGTSSDLKKLINLIKDRVKEKFDVDLKEEVFYLK